jgi:prevent-host-death family protein
MATVPATEFKAKCLELMDRVAEGRETFVITKRGKAVAKLVPADPPKRKSILGYMVGRMEIVGDLDQPLWTEEQWKALERERAQQATAWEAEWRRYGTISGKKSSGSTPPPPSAKRRAGARKARRGPRR